MSNSNPAPRMRRCMTCVLSLLAIVSFGCREDTKFQVQTEPIPGTGTMEAVPYPGVVIATEDRYGLNKEKHIDLVKGTENSPTASLQTTFHFGTKEAMTELTWRRTESNSTGDHYTFTLRRFGGDIKETKQTKDLVYSGQSTVLFAYGDHEFSLEPLELKPDSEPR